MAMVAAAVANGGKLIRPTFLESVTDPDGRTTDELDPEVASTAMSEETAATLGEMMTNVTQEGTAAGLTVPGVSEFAGKTGTAEVLGGDCPSNRGWFVAFAPTQEPQVAAAAVVECTSGFGGETAGPIATEVMGSLIGQGE
jgi:peptidoglycan glycosyltransferase